MKYKQKSKRALRSVVDLLLFVQGLPEVTVEEECFLDSNHFCFTKLTRKQDIQALKENLLLWRKAVVECFEIWLECLYVYVLF